VEPSGTERDHWAEWLLRRRSGGDAAREQQMRQGMLGRVRDRVLDNARVQPGDTVLDVGCGDGLIALGALDRVGSSGRVIFTDISQDLLDLCAALVHELGREGRCDFIRASADDLAPIPDSFVNVVTTRSVLIYVVAKQMAFNEFYRVLRPGGRLSIFEPINRFTYPEPPGRFMGYGVTPVQALADKVAAVYARQEQAAMESMIDFGERDLLRYAERAGFPEIQVDAHFQVTKYPATVPSAQSDQPGSAWDTWLRSAPNPLAPTLEEAMAAALTPEEAERFTAHLRPLYETHQIEERQELAYLWGVKHGDASGA
jgi:ubiquinone/menaquinone biosynthesis C-methylase UbiE